jgi:hypothetical protein
MPCESCGKPIEKDEDFILVGKYPKYTKIYMMSQAKITVRPEAYGKIYHKDCFMEILKKEMKQK